MDAIKPPIYIKYESATGARYQYDLNDPADRLRSEHDPSEKLRDGINPDPAVEIDKNVNQNGGGAEW